MLGELVKIGEVVVLDVCKENREWGYNPGSDGTRAEILSFGEIAHGRGDGLGYPPGIYVNRCWMNIRYLEGDREGEEDCMSCCHLAPGDKDEYARRVEERRARYARLREQGEESPFLSEKEFLRELPETEFYEGDKVVIVRPGEHFDKETGTVSRIEYSAIESGRTRDDGSPWPIYDVHLDSGGTVSMEESWIELLERGNIWKEFHGEELVFSSLMEEATYHKRMGRAQEIRNPKDGYYTFTKDEALDAIESGIGHSIAVGGGLFGCGPTTSVYRFDDEELGGRVAAETLKGFDR